MLSEVLVGSKLSSFRYFFNYKTFVECFPHFMQGIKDVEYIDL